MATVEQDIQYAIESDANYLLNQLSGEVSNLVLAHATNRAKERTEAGRPPVVTRDDVLSSAETLVKLFQDAELWIKEKDSDNEAATGALGALGYLREAIQALCANTGNARTKTPSPIR